MERDGLVTNFGGQLMWREECDRYLQRPRGNHVLDTLPFTG